MNKLLISLFLFSFTCFCQVTIYTGQPLLVGQHSYSTTNAVEATTNCFGFLLTTNSLDRFNWQFPAQIVRGTNEVIDIYQYGTNDSSVYYNIITRIYHPTNGLIVSFTNSLASSATSNHVTYSFTNNVSTNYLFANTNLSFGTISFQHVSNNVAIGNCYLLGGKVTFRN